MDTSLETSLDTPALRFINGPEKRVPDPPSSTECASQLEAVAQHLKEDGTLSFIVGNRSVDQAPNLKKVLLASSDSSGLNLMGRLLADGRARLVGQTTYRDETATAKVVFRTLSVYLGYSHRIAFWAWTDYQDRVLYEDDDTFNGGFLEAANLEELFTIWNEEPGRVLNGLLKVVKNMSDSEAERKRQTANDLDGTSLTLKGMTDQLDKMLPPVVVDDSQFDWWPGSMERNKPSVDTPAP